ncbi:MAG: hypothetical protein ACJAZS_000260 [Alteromonas naphthalenivorans]|jgi:hypothetical protein
MNKKLLLSLAFEIMFLNAADEESSEAKVALEKDKKNKKKVTQIVELTKKVDELERLIALAFKEKE